MQAYRVNSEIMLAAGTCVNRLAIDKRTARIAALVEGGFDQRDLPDDRRRMRRFTRLTNCFSKKVENHGHTVALYSMHYNFCRAHKSLRVTPAMEARLTDHVWSVEELLCVLPQNQFVGTRQ